jgi:hypothetical protein
VSVAPSSRYVLDITIDQRTLDNLRQLQRLLESEIPSGDPGLILERALALLKEEMVSRQRTIRPGTG